MKGLWDWLWNNPDVLRRWFHRIMFGLVGLDVVVVLTLVAFRALAGLIK